MSPDRHVSRRRVLRAAGASAAALPAAATLTATTAAQPAASMTIDQSASGGETVVLSSLTTSVDASVFVENQVHEQVGGSGVTFDAGADRQDVQIPLDSPLEESQPVQVTLYESNGGPIAEAAAFVRVDGEPDGAPAEEPAVSVDQAASDADAVVLESLRTDVDASLLVLDGGAEIGGQGLRFHAGASVEDHAVPLTESLAEGQAVEVALFESNAGQIAGATYVHGEAANEVTLRVEDQTTAGEEIVVAEVATDVDASLFVRDAAGETIGGSGVTFSASESVTDLAVPLSAPLEEAQSVEVVLYESNAGQIASDEAQVTVEAPACGGVEGAEVQTVAGTDVCDLDGDGEFRDVTADGTVDEADVAALFRHQHRDAWKHPEYFDFSGNDRVTHGDVIVLFQDVAATVA